MSRSSLLRADGLCIDAPGMEGARLRYGTWDSRDADREHVVTLPYELDPRSDGAKDLRAARRPTDDEHASG